MGLIKRYSLHHPQPTVTRWFGNQGSRVFKSHEVTEVNLGTLRYTTVLRDKHKQEKKVPLCFTSKRDRLDEGQNMLEEGASSSSYTFLGHLTARSVLALAFMYALSHRRRLPGIPRAEHRISSPSVQGPNTCQPSHHNPNPSLHELSMYCNEQDTAPLLWPGM